MVTLKPKENIVSEEIKESIKKENLDDVIKDKLQEFYLKGMAVGAKTISQAVINKLYYSPSSSRQDLKKKIDNAVEFCKIGLGAKDKIDNDYKESK